MAESRGRCDRRRFLLNSASFLAGTFFGLDHFSRAFAFDTPIPSPPLHSRIALIIDDIGYSRSRAGQFLELNIPITYSILPRLANSSKLACEIHEQGHEIMLHQPMEPYNSEIDPGPGALFVGDTANRIIKTMEKNISDIPFAIGVNNHMGSRFTSSPWKMNQALGVIKKRALFFVDSLTSSRSTAYQRAKALRVPAAFRNIFLDNHPNESSIIYQLHRLKKHAQVYGTAIGIGHPYQETIRAITHYLPHLETSDISLVPISDLVPSA